MDILTKLSAATARRGPTHLGLRSFFVLAMLSILVFCLLNRNLLLANDSAASLAAGGIQLTRDARISMEKERLIIRHDKVIVEYEFLNETDRDITTEVAFPVPPYSFYWENSGGPRSFDDFEISVEDKPVKYLTQTNATLKERDESELLRKLGVDISSFGHFNNWNMENTPVYEATKLPRIDRENLVSAGLIDGKSFLPLWTVNKTYYWAQTFPAHHILHVRHEYTPAWGWMDVMAGQLDPIHRAGEIRKLKEQIQNNPADATSSNELFALKDIEDFCIDSSLMQNITRDLWTGIDSAKKDNLRDDYVLFWVDYILTTANNWKRPIKDFELEVDRPNSFLSRKWYVTFCWDGPIEKIGADRFIVRVKNFVPTKNLHIGFLGVELQPIK